MRFFEHFIYFVLLSSFICSDKFYAQTSTSAGLSPQQIQAKLKKLKKEFYADPDLAHLTKASSELSKIKDQTTWIAKNPKDPISMQFKEFHLSLLEITKANAMLSQCTKGVSILDRKVGGITEVLARMNKSNIKSSATCSLKDKKEALDDLDVYSALLDKQQSTPEQNKKVEDDLWKTISNQDQYYEKQRALYQSTQGHSDFLGTKAVYGTTEMARSIAKEQSKQIEIKAKKNVAASGFRPEAGYETADYINKKYGFDLKKNNKTEDTKRAQELHLELMEGNRNNCFRNYLYFTQRFSFSDPKNVIPETTASSSLESKALSLFKGQAYPNIRTLPKYEEQELAKLGMKELQRYQKDYGQHRKLSEDDILKMIEPAMVSIQDLNSKVNEVKNSKQASLDNGYSQSLNLNLKNSAVTSLKSMRLPAGFEKIKSSEVGFILQSKAFGNKLDQLKNMTLEEKRKMIRDAVQENVESTEKYANWITTKQGTTNFMRQEKGAWDYAQVAETLMYSSPSVIQDVISKNPQLLGSMCLPLKEAAKKRSDEVPDWVTWGGGSMILFNGPVAPILGTAFGIASTAASIADHQGKIIDLEKQNELVGLGEDIRGKNWSEVQADQSEFKGSIGRHQDAITSDVKSFVVSEVAGVAVTRGVRSKNFPKNLTSSENELSAIRKIDASIEKNVMNTESGKNGFALLEDAYVQKSNGSTSAAKIIGFSQDLQGRKTALVSWTEQGKKLSKTVLVDDLKSGVFKEMDKVFFQRSNGGTSKGTIIAISEKDGIRTARVMWTENGRTLVKDVKLKDLISESKIISSKNEAIVKVDGKEAIDLSSMSEESKLKRMAQQVDQKYGVKMIYGEELKDRGISGYFKSGAEVVTADGLKKEMPVINISQRGFVAEKAGVTEWHEVGHLKTKQNIIENVKDPLAVQFFPRGLDPKIPYSIYAQADESRQQALNLMKSTRFNSEAVILNNFRKDKTIKLKDLFTSAAENKKVLNGLDYENVKKSLSESNFRLNILKDMNQRHTEYLDNAIGDISINPDKKIGQLERYSDGQLFLKINTKGSDIKIPVTKDEYKNFNSLTTQTAQIEFERKYVVEYLNSTKKMLQDQKSALIEADAILQEIKSNPDRKVTKEEYLKMRSTFTRVKSSVNLKSP
ncbi:MAG: hypothetical protein H7Z71_12260 [Moraxellaceae bacterium]|nr:hypothetical protein [Pseudobdellovibrionaceae bacterium]